MKMKINILGTEYTIQEMSKSEDNYLEKCDGYCDKTTHKIVICTKSEDNELSDFDVYRKKVIRHEIIHAFLFESGLHENWKHDTWGHDETFIDWIAAQAPKLLKAFREADAL